VSAALPTWLRLYGLLLASTVFAAAGQVLFKLGAADRTALRDFLNPQIAGGGALYFLGAVLWIAALSKAPLSVAYPFTALTFVLVYLASAFLLGDRPPAGAIVGVGLVLAGLGLIFRSR
jgi:undecaprenyl phosphate-alpha-L-ara4N flippase subunit ArnE